MNEGRPQPEKEALLVKLSKLLNLTPSSFLKIDPELRRSSTLSVLAALSLSDPLSRDTVERMRNIWRAGVDAGVLKPEDEKDIFG